jgi:uncharacterized protein (DUF2267 family)
MHVFDKATQHASTWVKDMMEALGTDDARKGLHALRAGLHALRDRLSVDEAAQLSAQLPLVIRGLYFEGWHPSDKPLRIRRRAEFLALVRDKYGPRTDAAADDIVTATFRVLGKHVSTGELTELMMTLPAELVDVADGGHEQRAEDR